MIARRKVHSALGPINIEMDAPEPFGQDFSCVYRLRGPRIQKRGRVLGIDGFQAIQLAMERLGADLRASAEFEAGPLEWLDMNEPGFPLPPSIAHIGWGRP